MKTEVLNLKKYFGKTKAVDDISFSFESGQIVGFVGPNGAGKTTTMRILATLDEPTGGEATVDGVSVIEDPEKARKLIGYVPDSLPAHRDVTVHEYLDFFARAYGIRGARRREVVESIEEFTHLTEIREKWVMALSKGMKQRVSLARSLVHDPPVLIMDEPAAGLDPRARIELRELLKLLAGQGKAILISSHILTELAEICNAAVIIEQGRILRAGSLDEILRSATPESEGPRRTLRLRALGDLGALHKAVLEMPHVLEVRVVAEEVEVDIEGDDRAAGEMLAELIRREFQVVEFRQLRAGLEDLFMTVTKGHVQ